jgi:sugar/nucleoside kinase (ribokinase family)
MVRVHRHHPGFDIPFRRRLISGTICRVRGRRFDRPGKVVDALGGSSIYFAYAASFFTDVRLVGVVGDDCPPDFLKPLRDNPRIDLAGLEIRAGSKTFRWHGRYHADVNVRDTVSVDLNVLGEVGPTIPDAFRDSKYVFLANTHPVLQLELLGQLTEPSLVVADTMDLWITTERDAVSALLDHIDGLVLNDSEAKLMTGKANVVAAGIEIARRVRRFVVVKKGEHGSLLFAGEKVCALPSYPAQKVVDPTGAGDSFAGAMMGYVTASIELEDFSLNRFLTTTRADIDARLAQYKELTTF